MKYRKDRVSSKKYRIINGRKYYYNRSDAERARKSGQRIYHTKELGYFIVTPKKRN